jgi:hypothetical protein
MFKEHDLVFLTKPLFTDEILIEEGTIGVILFIYNFGKQYEVEFLENGGKTIAIGVVDLEFSQKCPN